MPDERTHDIYHVDEPEGCGAPQEVTTELEQAEAETKKYHDAWLEVEIVELEAKLAKAVEALGGMVGLFSGYSLLLKGMHLNMELDNARTTLAELSSVSCANSKGQDDD